jgi:thiol-disulfide isomerase/thioredoxin
MVFVHRVITQNFEAMKIKSKKNSLLMTFKISAILLSLFCTTFLNAQSIKGNLMQLGNQAIRLEGFNGLKTYPISATTINDKGNFSLTYSKADYGVGYLISSDEKPFFVILSCEDVEIVGELLSNTKTIKLANGQENQWFEQYAQEHPRREQALSAWVYLEKMYTLDSLFAVQELPSKAIQEEKQRIQKEDLAFLKSLPEDSYVSWFLPTRKLVSSVSAVAQYRTEELPATIEAFRALNYADPRLYKSGLFKDAIDNHFWLIENSGRSLDGVYREMEKSIDLILPNLLKDNEKLNIVADYLFNLLEARSLFRVAEYLALRLLNDKNCTLENNFARQLETYRAMKKGNTAPDIVFEKDHFNSSANAIASLSEIESPYTLVVFVASWCPKCTEELPEIAKRYAQWKEKGVEVVFIALEEDKQTFKDFANPFPFRSYSDLKKWDSKIVSDYYVFATPTFFLLDQNRNIVLRPNSVDHAEAWINTYNKL